MHMVIHICISHLLLNNKVSNVSKYPKSRVDRAFPLDTCKKIMCPHVSNVSKKRPKPAGLAMNSSVHPLNALLHMVATTCIQNDVFRQHFPDLDTLWTDLDTFGHFHVSNFCMMCDVFVYDM